MSLVNPTPNDRVRYIFIHRTTGAQETVPPEGWNTDDKEWERHDTYSGIFPKFSNNLKFSGEAREYLKHIFEAEDVEGELRLVKEERHPQTDVWTRVYDGYLDFSTYQDEDGKISIKFNSGGMEQILKSRESEDIELERLTTLSGRALPPIKVEEVDLPGRRIFLDSRWDVKPTSSEAQNSLASKGNTRNQITAVPLNLYSNSHEELGHSPIPNSHGDGGDKGSAALIFFGIADRDRLLHIKLDLSFTTNILQFKDVNSGFYKVSIGKYRNGDNFDISNDAFTNDDRIMLLDTYVSGDPDELRALGGTGFTSPYTGINTNPPKNWSVSWEGDILVRQGESLALDVWTRADLGNSVTEGHFRVKTQNIVGEMRVTEDSFFEPTKCKAILTHEMMDRIVEVITDRPGVFRSNFFGRTDLGYAENGPGAFTAQTHGFWVRGFDALPAHTDQNPNPYKPMTTNLKDALASFAAIWNVGLGIEKNGYDEKIIIEDKRYFFNRNVLVKLRAPIKDAKITVATKHYFSGLEFGYEKGGEYQEANGLDEYNARTNWATVITRLSNKLSRLSKYRADSYGKEFCRRKSKATRPSEDTPYDTDIWHLDLKKSPNSPIFRERTYSDDCEAMPSGIYSPETATGLRLTPTAMLLRSGWEIAAGLVKFPMDYIRYGGSTANSRLRTKLNGQPERVENEDIINSDLERARYLARFIEFEHVCDFDTMSQIEGFTIINGRRVPNIYGLIEFEYQGKKLKGWLDNLKPNSNKFRLLLFNQ